MEATAGFWAFYDVVWHCMFGPRNCAQFTEPSVLYNTTIHKGE